MDPDPDPYWIRIGIQPKMLELELDPDPDPDEMNTDPQPWFKRRVRKSTRGFGRNFVILSLNMILSWLPLPRIPSPCFSTF